MRFPWNLPQCDYPGCDRKVRKSGEHHCKIHYDLILTKIGKIIARRQEERGQ